jgi:hypothetical protein
VTNGLQPSLWRRFRNSLRHRKRKKGATIDLNPDGFVFTYRDNATAMRWNDITRIDAGVRDYLTFESFFAVMVAGDVQVTIEEFDDGYQQFENEIFARWPQIRERWLEFVKNAPHQARLETLWTRDG